MVSDATNDTAIGPSSHTSVMSPSKEHGIHGPLHLQQTAEQSNNMSQLMLATLTTNNESNKQHQPPPQSPLMNAFQDIGGIKRPVPIGDEVPHEAKRIKVEDDSPLPPISESSSSSMSKVQAAVPPIPAIKEPSVAAAVVQEVQQEVKPLSAAATCTTTDEPASPIAAASQSLNSTVVTSSPTSTSVASAPVAQEQEMKTEQVMKASPLVSPKNGSSSVATSSFSSCGSSSSSVGESSQAKQPLAPPAESAQAPPLKSTCMAHLEQKYHAELEYMLREFRKLERQLLGAKGNGTGIEESAGSRERREKLHSFILHLEDTIRQVEVGCRLEREGKSTIVAGEEERQQVANSAALTNLTKEKEEEENVQKLEEHILANLLPVKVRLKKQLAAQQGATRNPIGMPAARRGMQPSAAAELGKGTFTVAAEERRKQAEAAREAAEHKSAMAMAAPATPTQFGKPLSGGGSSLTQKLHGSTLGSQNRVHGHGVGIAEPPVPDPTTAPEAALTEVAAPEDASSPAPTRKILYGGMAPGSNQHKSGVSAAAGVHPMIVDTPNSPMTPLAKAPAAARTVRAAALKPHPSLVPPPKANSSKPAQQKPYDDPDLTEEEQKKVRKDRRKRKKARELRRREKERQRQLFLQQQAVQASQQLPKGPLGGGKKVGKGVMKCAKKKGPRSVEYICALCSEAYSSTCDYNPWWALASHECPKCRKSQVPRIDITSPANAIEYHPALLAHAEEGPGGGSTMSSAPPPSVLHHMNPMPGFHPRPPVGSTKYPSMYPLSDSDDESDLSELSDTGTLSEDSEDSDDSEDEMPLTEGELAELEVFGKDYEGPKLTPDQSSRLMILMGHAQTCPGRHKSVKHRDCCNSVKYLMLHVRDCPGTTATFDVCPFPWCRKVKHLMYHMVACPRPRDCAICSPISLSPPLRSLIGLNNYRRKKHRERMKAVMAAAAAAAKAKPVPPRVPYVPKGAKPASYRPPAKKTTAAKYKTATPKHVAPRITPISRPGAKPIARGLTLIKPSNGVRVKSLVKPVGRSIVILKARPQRPALNVAKPTVAALPGAETVAKSGPTPVVSSIGAMTKPTVESIQVPAPLSILVPTKPVVANALVAAPLAAAKAKSSAAVVAALAVNALEEAAKAAMESSTESKTTPKGAAKEAVPTASKIEAKQASDAAMKKAVSVNSIAVATASAIAAAMVTGTVKPAATKGDAAKPAVEEQIVEKPVASKEEATVVKPAASKEEATVANPAATKEELIVTKPAAAKEVPPAVARKAQPVTPVTSAAVSEHSDSSCDTSVSKSSTVVAAPLVVETLQDEANASKADSMEPSIKDEANGEQSSTNASLQKQALAKTAQFLRDVEIKQESLSTSTGPDQSLAHEEDRPAPPRFPEVPSIVKQEASDEAEKEAPQEVPPV